MQKSYCYTTGASVGIRKQNVRANVKVMEFQSLRIFSCILVLLIILIKPLATKLTTGMHPVTVAPLVNFYTPVFRRNVLWYGDVRPSVRSSVRPGLRPGLHWSVIIFCTFLLYALMDWAEILHVTYFLWTFDQARVSSISVKFCRSYAPFGT